MELSNYKRKEERKTVSWPVHVRTPTSQIISAHALDVSSGGVFVRQSKDDPFPKKGDELFVTLFPTGRAHLATGIIRWTGFSQAHSCEGFGIEFNDTEQIKELLGDHDSYVGEPIKD